MPSLPDAKISLDQSVEAGEYADYQAYVDQERKRRRGRRFFHFLTSLAFFGLLFFYVGGHGKQDLASFTKIWESTGIDPHVYPIPPGINLEDCAEWEDTSGLFHHSSSSKLILDSSSDLLFISRGSFSSGSFELSQSSSETKDEVEVGVTVHYHRDHVLDFIKVCKITHDDGRTGVGIFTPQWHGRRRPHRGPGPIFTVNVKLPKPKGTNPLVVNSFETDLPLFTHHAPALGESVFFRKIRLTSANAPIQIESLNGAVVNVETVNSAIRGRFTTNSTIDLQTVNAPIEVFLDLYNSNLTYATSAKLTTTNGRIDLATNLTTSPDNDGGSYNIDASTVNAKVEVGIVDAPVDSILTVNARSVLGPVEAKLHPTYQGNFFLETTLARAALHYNPDAEDPAGRGRKRGLSLPQVSGSRVKGSTWWSDEGKTLGNVTLRTTLAPVSIVL